MKTILAGFFILASVCSFTVSAKAAPQFNAAAVVSSCTVDYSLFDAYNYTQQGTLNFVSSDPVNPQILDPAVLNLSLSPGYVRFSYSIDITGYYSAAAGPFPREYKLTVVLTESVNGNKKVLATSEVRKLKNESSPLVKLLNPQPLQIALDNGFGYDIGRAAYAKVVPKDMLRSVSVNCAWP